MSTVLAGLGKEEKNPSEKKMASQQPVVKETLFDHVLNALKKNYQEDHEFNFDNGVEKPKYKTLSYVDPKVFQEAYIDPYISLYLTNDSHFKIEMKLDGQNKNTEFKLIMVKVNKSSKNEYSVLFEEHKDYNKNQLEIVNTNNNNPSGPEDEQLFTLTSVEKTKYRNLHMIFYFFIRYNPEVPYVYYVYSIYGVDYKNIMNTTEKFSKDNITIKPSTQKIVSYAIETPVLTTTTTTTTTTIVTLATTTTATTTETTETTRTKEFSSQTFGGAAITLWYKYPIDKKSDNVRYELSSRIYPRKDTKLLENDLQIQYHLLAHFPFLYDDDLNFNVDEMDKKIDFDYVRYVMKKVSQTQKQAEKEGGEEENIHLLPNYIYQTLRQKNSNDDISLGLVIKDLFEKLLDEIKKPIDSVSKERTDNDSDTLKNLFHELSKTFTNVLGIQSFKKLINVDKALQKILLDGNNSGSNKDLDLTTKATSDFFNNDIDMHALYLILKTFGIKLPSTKSPLISVLKFFFYRNFIPISKSFFSDTTADRLNYESINSIYAHLVYQSNEANVDKIFNNFMKAMLLSYKAFELDPLLEENMLHINIDQEYDANVLFSSDIRKNIRNTFYIKLRHLFNSDKISGNFDTLLDDDYVRSGNKAERISLQNVPYMTEIQNILLWSPSSSSSSGNNNTFKLIEPSSIMSRWQNQFGVGSTVHYVKPFDTMVTLKIPKHKVKNLAGMNTVVWYYSKPDVDLFSDKLRNDDEYRNLVYKPTIVDRKISNKNNDNPNQDSGFGRGLSRSASQDEEDFDSSLTLDFPNTLNFEYFKKLDDKLHFFSPDLIKIRNIGHYYAMAFYSEPSTNNIFKNFLNTYSNSPYINSPPKLVYKVEIKLHKNYLDTLTLNLKNNQIIDKSNFPLKYPDTIENLIKSHVIVDDKEYEKKGKNKEAQSAALRAKKEEEVEKEGKNENLNPPSISNVIDYQLNKDGGKIEHVIKTRSDYLIPVDYSVDYKNLFNYMQTTTDEKNEELFGGIQKDLILLMEENGSPNQFGDILVKLGESYKDSEVSKKYIIQGKHQGLYYIFIHFSLGNYINNIKKKYYYYSTDPIIAFIINEKLNATDWDVNIRNAKDRFINLNRGLIDESDDTLLNGIVHMKIDNNELMTKKELLLLENDYIVLKIQVNVETRDYITGKKFDSENFEIGNKVWYEYSKPSIVSSEEQYFRNSYFDDIKTDLPKKVKATYDDIENQLLKANASSAYITLMTNLMIASFLEFNYDFFMRLFEEKNMERYSDNFSKVEKSFKDKKEYYFNQNYLIINKELADEILNRLKIIIPPYKNYIFKNETDKHHITKHLLNNFKEKLQFFVDRINYILQETKNDIVKKFKEILGLNENDKLAAENYPAPLDYAFYNAKHANRIVSTYKNGDVPPVSYAPIHYFIENCGDSILKLIETLFILKEIFLIDTKKIKFLITFNKPLKNIQIKISFPLYNAEEQGSLFDDENVITEFNSIESNIDFSKDKKGIYIFTMTNPSEVCVNNEVSIEKMYYFCASWSQINPMIMKKKNELGGEINFIKTLLNNQLVNKHAKLPNSYSNYMIRMNSAVSSKPLSKTENVLRKVYFDSYRTSPNQKTYMDIKGSEILIPFAQILQNLKKNWEEFKKTKDGSDEKLNDTYLALLGLTFSNINTIHSEYNRKLLVYYKKIPNY
jgi:hypothetical protein